MNKKRIILLVLLLIFLVGVASASAVSDDNVKSADTSSKLAQNTHTTPNTVENNHLQENLKKVEKSNKNVKTAGNVYVSSNGKGDGKTVTTPTNITNALSMVNNNDVIEILKPFIEFDTNYNKLLSYFSSSKFTLIPTNKKSVYLLPPYSTIGIDRCAIMEACIKLYLSTTNSNIAVLSFGTATTIDLISKDRKHLGGFILPGISSQLSLLSNCSNLPSLDIEEDSLYLSKDEGLTNLLGNTTNSSMINGVLYNTISLINNISSHFLVPHDTLVLTGGWSSFVFNLLNSLNKDNKIIPSDIRIVSNEYLSSLGTKILTVNG